MRSLLVFAGAVASLFVGLLLLSARSVLSILLIGAAVAAMFATSFSAFARRPVPPKGKSP